MSGSENADADKRNLPLGDENENDVDRNSRKRKSELEEISVFATSLAKQKGDREIKKIQITALSIPDGSLSEQAWYPLPKKRRIRQISIENINDASDPGGDAPKFKVCFRDIKKEEDDEDVVAQFKKTLRRAQFWRKILFSGKREKPRDGPEGPEGGKALPRVCRCCVTGSIAYDIGDKGMVFMKIRSLLLFCVTTFMLLVSIYGTFSPEKYFFSDGVTSLLIRKCIFYNAEGQANTFETISNRGDVKNYMSECFKAVIEKGPWGRVGSDNGVVVLSPPRLRQVRVKKKTCWISLYEDVVCYDFFNANSESTETFGPGGVGYEYSRSTDADIWFQGFYTNYNSHGFSYFLSDGDLINGDWIDAATSAVFVDLTLYSGDATLYCVVQLLFEFPPTGRVKSSFTARAFFLSQHTSSWAYFVLATEIMFVFMNVLATITILINLTYFKWRFFLSMGMLHSLVATFFGWYTSFLQLIHVYHAVQFFETRYKPEGFTDFQPILKEYVSCYSITVLAFLFHSFGVYGFLNISLMSHLRITLYECFKNIVVFSTAFTIILWAFVQIAYLLFGHSLERYRTFSRCFSELMKVTLGDLDFEGPRSIFRTVGPLFILVFIVSVVFVYINMFFAIINGTFSIVANNVDVDEESYSFFLLHCWEVLRVRYFKGTVHEPEVKPLSNSDHIRNLLLDSGYSNEEIKMFFCRYIVDDAQVVDDSVFAKMWNLRIQPERLQDLKGFVQQLETIVDLLLQKAEWLSGRINNAKEASLGRKNKTVRNLAL